MKFQADREVLSDAISFVVRMLSPRPQLPQLSGVMLEAKQGSLNLSVFDYEVSANVDIQANTDKEGKVLVQARLLAEIVSKLPADSVSFDLTDSRLQVVSGSSKFSLSAMSTSEYPTAPEAPDASATIAAEDFADAVGQVSVAASREEVTPVLTGVMMNVASKTVSFVATDRFRVAVRDLPSKGSKAEKEVLIPARVMAEVAKTFSHDKEIEIGLGAQDKELVSFRAGGKTVVTSTIKGKYPAVLQLFPESTPHFAVVNTHDLLDATRRVGLVVDRDKPVRYRFQDGEVSLESIGSDVADASEQLTCSLTGDEVVVSLKPQFLVDALGAIESEMVQIGFTTNPNNPNKPGPVLLSPVGSDNSYRYLLQPNLLVS